MLAGDDFKKDTIARGAVVVRVRKADDFKEGDLGFGPIHNGSSDPYCTLSWGKFGKPMFSTRIILGEMKPYWDEWAALLVGPDELNADEILRVQLWDSDRSTADDDLGRVEVSLKELMKRDETNGRFMERTDRLSGTKQGEMMPGTLTWSVGYFAKTRITSEQLADQSAEPEIKSVEDLKKRVSENTEKKLREATSHDESREISQQKSREYIEREENLIISTRPPDDYPSGVLSIQIHQITGLDLEQINKSDNETDHEKEESDDLPSAYCTIILNHVKIYRTRTKPKSAKPFFNAGTERFIRDWRTAEVMISARDSRGHEDDPLLGLVYLPLAKLFENRSQVMDSYPLAGGIGYGRARISMVFRSVDLKLSKELIGWDYGTVEINGGIKPIDLQSDLQKLRIRVDNGVSHGHMNPSSDHDSQIWNPKRGRNSLCLAVKKRYCTSVLFQFRKHSLGPDSTPAWAVFWLKDIPDDEEKTVRLQVWSSKEDMKRGRDCCDFEKDEQHSLGEIEVTLKFWRGLSGYHQNLASKGKQQDMRDVMEALDAINDTYGHDDEEDEHGDTDTSDETIASEDQPDSNISNAKESELPHHAPAPPKSTDGDPDQSHGFKETAKHLLQVSTGTDKDQSEESSRGPFNQIRDYQRHHKQLHRKHRGVMQWKTVRSLDWAKHKVSDTKDSIMSLTSHRERQPGMETEV